MKEKNQRQKQRPKSKPKQKSKHFLWNHKCEFYSFSSAKNKKQLTRCVGEPEGHRLVLDVAHVADGHLARVIGEIFGSEIFQLQDFGLTLKKKRMKETELVWLTGVKHTICNTTSSRHYVEHHDDGALQASREAAALTILLGALHVSHFTQLCEQ